ncbi:MAG: hypothetical protein FWE07_08805 [Turicibacter sp.]|nr:hypothetical protein [Turicibacter sp.]
MNMKRKILIAVVALLLLLGLGYAVIRPHIPEWVVGQMMAQITELEVAELEFDVEMSDSQHELVVILGDFLLDTLTYDITGSRIEGRAAYVTMNLTFVNIPRLLIDNAQLAIDSVSTDFGFFLNVLFGDINLEELLVDVIGDVLVNDNLRVTMVTQEVEVELERAGLLWQPLITDEWLLEIFGLDNLDFLDILEELIQF